MKEFKPVDIPCGSFNFCKYTIAALLWGALLLQIKMIVAICFVLLLASALLKVKNAPLVFFYTHTIDRIIKSNRIILDENAVQFAHIVGAIFSGTALVFLYFLQPLTGWIITGILALLKTSGAFGFCGAMKLYGCLSNPNGTCCRVGKKIRKHGRNRCNL